MNNKKIKKLIQKLLMILEKIILLPKIKPKYKFLKNLNTVNLTPSF